MVQGGRIYLWGWKMGILWVSEGDGNLGLRNKGTNFAEGKRGCGVRKERVWCGRKEEGNVTSQRKKGNEGGRRKLWV